MVLRPLVLPKHLAQAVLGMDTMKRQRPLGLAVLLHWKGYLVVKDGKLGQGSIGPPKWGGKSGRRKSGRTWRRSEPRKEGQWIFRGFWRGKLGDFQKPHVLQVLGNPQAKSRKVSNHRKSATRFAAKSAAKSAAKFPPQNPPQNPPRNPPRNPPPDPPQNPPENPPP